MEQAAQRGWIDAIIVDLFRQMRWSFVPPLMVYFAFGFTGLTAIVGTFFSRNTSIFRRPIWLGWLFGRAFLGR